MNVKLAISSLVMASIAISALSISVMFQQTAQDSGVVFQVSSLDSLLNGSYEGKTTVHNLLDHGDFGLGALEYMDGELVCLDAVCYRIPVDGAVHTLSPEYQVAFAAVSFFQSDKTFDVHNQHNFTELQKYLDGELEENKIFAIQIHGFFSDMTTRSVPKQDKLYVPLSDVVANQTLFNSSNVEGTLVGFYFPDYMKEVNVAKYHFHFITDDLEFGGHLIDMDIANGTIQISEIGEVRIVP